MARYIMKRLLWMIPIVLGVAVMVFTLMTFCPGDPAAIVLGSTATEQDLALMREQMGLNEPFIVRLGTFLSDTFIRFDLGESWITGASIKAELLERLPRTMVLSLTTLTLSILIGMPLGIAAAVKQNGWQDNLCMTFALLGVSIPNFWLALLLILLFSVNLGWLPAMGIGSWKNYILPAMAGCMGGAMVIETIFSIPGMGMYIVTGVNSRNYPVVQAGTIFLAIVFSFCMLVVDLVYAAVDPRIKAQYKPKGRKVKNHG